MSIDQASSSPIGFIGLGNMGLPMGARLVEGGRQVLAYDVSAQTAEQFAKKTGARIASLQEIGKACRVIILMLPNGDIVRSVVLGDGQSGIADACAKGTIIIDMSSSSPTGTQALGGELAKRDIALIDAPVSGGVKRAVTGMLAIMVGGDSSVIEQAKPVLKLMGSSIIETGPLGSGHAMKALNNYVSAAGLIAACEALEVGERFGIAPETIVDVLNSSTGKNNSTENKLKPFIVSRAFNSGFSVGLMRKDLAIAVDLAKAVKAGTPLAETVLANWADAEKRYGGAADHTEIHRLVLDTARGPAPAKK